MPCCFHERAIIPSPPNLSSFTHSLSSHCSSHSPPQTGRWFIFHHRELHRWKRPCFFATSLPLHRRFIAAWPCLASSSGSKHLCTGRISTAGFSAMSVSTLSSHLLQSIYLLTVRRRTLVDMHCGYPRVRVRSEYCSGGFFPLLTCR
jgi:hypothetical protein